MESIDKEKYESALKDDKISKIFSTFRNQMILFINDQLAKLQTREDYKELLTSALKFLCAEDEKKTFSVRCPGACNRARWMAKIIYCLKIYIFRKQFKLTAHDLAAIHDFNVFIVEVYFKKWYTCQVSISAPLNDLKLLKELINYKSINKKVSEHTYEIFTRQEPTGTWIT